MNIIKCVSGVGITIVALDFYSYHVHELLVSLVLFTAVFLVLALATFAAVLLWWLSEQLVNKSGPASRKFIAFSRRLIAAHARP